MTYVHVIQCYNLLLKLLDLKLGRCKVAFGLRAGEKLNFDKSKITIATKHEKIAKKFFEEKAMAVEIIKLYGSIELAPLVGLCDCIVDIVETGETMKQNGLEVGPTSKPFCFIVSPVSTISTIQSHNPTKGASSIEP